MAASAISALASTLLAGSAGITLFGSTYFGFTAFLAATATYAVLGAISRSLYDDGLGDTANGINFNVRDPASTRKIVYGKCRVGGTIVFFNTSDTDNQYLHMVIAVAGHEIESFEEVYFGDEKVWQGGSYLNDWDDHCLLSFHTGTSTQTADSTLVAAATGWTSDHKLLDTAYIYVRHEFDAEKYVSGVPNVSCVIKGKKVYDPGTDTTVWSDNPALILNDYLTDTKYGLGEASTNIDATALTTAEAICDEDMPISATENQQKYTCNGILDSGSSIKANIENILTSMMGSLHWSNGKFYMFAHKYVDPVSDQITDDMIVSPIQVLTKRSRSSLYNTVKGKFISEEANYIVADYPAQSISSYVTNDGEEVALDLTLPMTTENNRAQRIAYLTMKKSRLQMSIKLQLNLEGLKYKVGDNVEVVNERFGWTSASPKVFEITNFQLTPDPERGLVVSIDAVENEDVDDWTGSTATTYQIPNQPSVYTGTTVIAPTNLAVFGLGQPPPKKDNQSVDAKVIWDGVTEADGADPYEPYLSHYVVTVKDTGNGTMRDQEYTTTNTEQIVQVYRSKRSKAAVGETIIAVKAVNIRGYESAEVSISGLTPAMLQPEPVPLAQELVFEDTVADPDDEHIAELVTNAGVELVDGLEITYVQVDGDGDPVDAAEYVYESEDFRVAILSNPDHSEIDSAASFPEKIENGTFSDTSYWNLTGSAFAITGGKLVGTDVTTNDHAYQNVYAPDGNHTITFDVDSITLGVGGTFNVRVYERDDVILNESITSTGTKTFTFSSQNAFTTLVFSGSQADVTIDNVSVKRSNVNAIRKYKVYLPESVTQDVTFAHTESATQGVPATGVTQTFTGFTGTNLVDDQGRKYVEVSLERSYTEVGYSQFVTTITGTWTVTESFGDVSKVAEQVILFSARVT